MDRRRQGPRGAIVKLIELHIKATELLTKNPEIAAPHVKNFVAKGLVEEALILKALLSPSANFRPDPADIIEPAASMRKFRKDYKIRNKKVTTRELFDASIYQKAAANLGL